MILLTRDKIYLKRDLLFFSLKWVKSTFRKKFAQQCKKLLETQKVAGASLWQEKFSSYFMKFLSFRQRILVSFEIRLAISDFWWERTYVKIYFLIGKTIASTWLWLDESAALDSTVSCNYHIWWWIFCMLGVNW